MITGSVSYTIVFYNGCWQPISNVPREAIRFIPVEEFDNHVIKIIDKDNREFLAGLRQIIYPENILTPMYLEL